VKERIYILHSSQGSKSRSQLYMETSLMSESSVYASDVEETVTQVLTQFVQGGGEQAAMSVELLQEQVELRLEYAAGFLSKCQNFLEWKITQFFSVKESRVSAHTLSWASKVSQPAPVPRDRPPKGMVWHATENPIAKGKACNVTATTIRNSSTGLKHVQECTSRSHPVSLRPRAGGGVEVEVHDILSVTDRADEVNGHVRDMTQNAGSAQSGEAGDVQVLLSRT
jgi:hypothetical protein